MFMFFLYTTKSFAQQIPLETYGALNYRLVGPFRGGRSTTVTGVPGKPNVFYFGASGGGVWKTEDGGKTWKNVSDGYFGGSIGSIAISKSDPNVIYVGGGEKTLRGNVSSGYGVWKSVDAGKTWKQSGLLKSRHIPRMVVHPNNPEILYAGVLGNIYKPTDDRGVYKSVDGGNTWNLVLFSNENSGVVDLTLDPNNARILYASTWNVRRTPYSLSSGGIGSGLWKSTDSGTSWKEISKNKGFAKDTLGIIGITVSPVDSNRIWAIVENRENGGVYRSDDGGETWDYINSDRSLRQRAWYYTRIYADSEDKDLVYVVNVKYHKSKDGGKTFTSHRAPHGDHHDLWIAPEDAKRMIIGDDGGAQVTYDGGTTWSTYLNQPTAQFYRVTTDNSFPYRIYAAQQDNTAIRIKHRSPNQSISEKDWQVTAGGESAHIAIDPKNNDIVYGGSYDGFLTRVNHKTESVRSISVWPDNPMGHGAKDLKYRFQWNFPILFSKHNPNKLYAFSNHVHLTENEGQSWKVLSPDLTRNDSDKLLPSGGPITKDNTSVEYYCTIFAANESPIKEGLLWVGSDDGLVHLSKDHGKTWQNVTPKKMPEWMMINSIEPSAFDEGTCYIAGSRYKSGDFKPYLYKTTDYGKTWVQISNGIPDDHFTRVLREDPNKKGLLYAGTETGMYVSFNDGEFWQPLQQNLPVVPITDLVIKDNNLIVATQGRSIWIIDDLTLLHQLTERTKNEKYVLFEPKPTYRMKGYSSEPSLKEGTNHPSGVLTHFNLKNFNKDKDTLRLSYLTIGNDTIRSFSTAATDEDHKLKEIKQGGNRFIWDMRAQGAQKLDEMILWWADLKGPKVVPNEYQVVLQVNDELPIKQIFSILADPRSEATIAQMQQQFDFVKEVNSTIDKAHQSIKKIRGIKKQLEKFIAKYEKNKETETLIERAKNLTLDLSAIEKELYQTKNKSDQDPLNFPIKLTNKLGHLNALIGMSDFGPTDQDIKVKNELTEKINNQLNTLDQLIQEDLKSFNDAYNEMKLSFILVDDEI